MLSGEKAYADYCLKHINTLGIARLLSVKPEEAGDAVVRLKQKNIEMKKKSNSSKRTVCTAGSTGEKIMAKEKEIKTNAMRILDRQKIKYEVLQYECDEFIDGLHTAEKTGAPVEQSFKTLVAQGKASSIMCWCFRLQRSRPEKAAKAVGRNPSR